MTSSGSPVSREALRVGVAAFLVLFLLEEIVQLGRLRAPDASSVRSFYALLLLAGSAGLLYGIVRRISWIGKAAVAFFGIQLLLDPLVHFFVGFGARMAMAGRLSDDPFMRMALAGGGFRDPSDFVGSFRTAMAGAGLLDGLPAGIPMGAVLFVLLRYRPWAESAGGEGDGGVPHGIARMAEMVEAVAARLGIYGALALVLVAYPLLYAAAMWLAFL
jgi:hypothetical protein